MNEKREEIWDIITRAMQEARSLERPHAFELDLLASIHTKKILKILEGRT